jgi:hypothetical protein
MLFQMPTLDSLSNLLGRLFDLLLDALSAIRVSLRPRCLWPLKSSSSEPVENSQRVGGSLQ